MAILLGYRGEQHVPRALESGQLSGHCGLRIWLNGERPVAIDPPRKSGGQVCCAAIKPLPVNWPHRLQRRYVHHAGPHSRCSNRQPQVREDSGPNGSRSEQRDLGRHLQPPAGNLSAQHHACQYVRPGRRDLLYLLMIPINAYRLRQMLALVRKARTATQGDMSMEWLKPFMTDRKYRKGDILMKKGDAANEMLLTVTGKFRVIEINVELPPGRLMGELGFLTLDNRRTATIECIEDGRVLTISYEKLLEIYFQNPQFGYYFLVLTSQRLLENLARAEAIIAQNNIAPQTPFAN